MALLRGMCQPSCFTSCHYDLHVSDLIDLCHLECNYYSDHHQQQQQDQHQQQNQQQEDRPSQCTLFFTMYIMLVGNQATIMCRTNFRSALLL